MRKVLASETVKSRIAELKDYLVSELKLSEHAALKRMDRIGRFLLNSLGNELADYAPCRFKRWRRLGYRCVPFEKKLGVRIRTI